MRDHLHKWLDWPPVWTAAGLIAIWAIGRLPPLIGFGTFGPGLSLACLGLGLWLMARAVMVMFRSSTTINPRGQPQALVSSGVFVISRNPIYLGDALVLLAAVFWVNEAFALPVVAGFVWVINDRFIPVEEERLANAFGDQAAEYFMRVRRWL